MEDEVSQLNSSPIVSVIVPVYNVESYLCRCVDSVLEQSFTDYELILVDDGSSDSSPIICDAYAKDNEKIKVVHKKNGGLADARAAGFERAAGEYILFVDSDDYIHRDMLEQMVSSMKTQQADLTICAYFEKRELREKAFLLPFQEEMISGKDHIIESYVKPMIGAETESSLVPGFLCIRMMKRELIQKSYFLSERIYYKEDHAFNLLYIDSVKTIAVVNKPLYYYCVNDNSLTNRYRENKWEMYSNLLFFYMDYIKKREIENCQKRLDHFLLAAFFASVDNAVLSGSFGGFLNELKKIQASKLIKRLRVSSMLGAVPATHRITYLLYCLHLYRLLYQFRKMRLKIS